MPTHVEHQDRRQHAQQEQHAPTRHEGKPLGEVGIGEPEHQRAEELSERRNPPAEGRRSRLGSWPECSPSPGRPRCPTPRPWRSRTGCASPRGRSGWARRPRSGRRRRRAPRRSAAPAFARTYPPASRRTARRTAAPLSVSVKLSRTAEPSTWKSCATSFTTKVRRKKSKASSVQPKQAGDEGRPLLTVQPAHFIPDHHRQHPRTRMGVSLAGSGRCGKQAWL